MAAGGAMTLLFDDLSDAFNYTGGSWTVFDGVWWMGGSQSSFFIQAGGSGKLPDATETGTFSFTFNGTSVAFVGEAPTSTHLEPCVYIDGGNPIYLEASVSTYQEWFQSPVLDYGEHTVLVTNFQQGSVDYAAVTIPDQESTPPNSTVIFDDTVPSVVYTGTWTTQPPSEYDSVFPYSNTSHFTTVLDSSFTINFSGTAISLYGLTPSGSTFAASQLVVNYTIDGHSPVSTSYDNTPLGPYPAQPNYLLFESQTLNSGPHVLQAQIIKCSGTTFFFDYFTVEPPPNAAGSGSQPESQGLSASGSASLPGGSGTPARADNSHSTHIAIVVSVLTVVLLFSTIAIVVSWSWWRRRRHQRRYMSQTPYTLNPIVDLSADLSLPPTLSSSSSSSSPPSPSSNSPSKLPTPVTTRGFSYPIGEKVPTYLPHYGDSSCQKLQIFVDDNGTQLVTLAHRSRPNSASDATSPSSNSPTAASDHPDVSSVPTLALSVPEPSIPNNRHSRIRSPESGRSSKSRDRLTRPPAPRVSIPPPYQEFDPTAYETDEEVPSLPPSFKTVAPISRGRGFQTDEEAPPLPSFKNIAAHSKTRGLQDHV
ncbi:hypothetical protein BDN72DRAFT_849982 [Pluteus cervinus]|uniref:Uncharacterized protein n=1 Tax=Pluteus cervinus TaxID=181527 RepID=A0ACD3A8B7_9AGAR|nr:hypothetical protein BDN72DRAFT_849982 [Pluteus cervinus]